MRNTKTGRSSIASALAFAFVSALIAIVIFAMFSPMLLFASTTNTVNLLLTGKLTVPSVCVPSISNTLISFASTGQTYVQAGLYAPTANAVNVINTGNAGGNLLVDGGNWIASSSAFLVSNTLWSATSGQNIGTQLTNSITGVDTTIYISGNPGSNVIYFGLNVPQGQAAATYTETINVLISC